MLKRNSRYPNILKSALNGKCSCVVPHGSAVVMRPLLVYSSGRSLSGDITSVWPASAIQLSVGQRIPERSSLTSTSSGRSCVDLVPACRFAIGLTQTLVVKQLALPKFELPNQLFYLPVHILCHPIASKVCAQHIQSAHSLVFKSAQTLMSVDTASVETSSCRYLW
jgi:hypothetical protein